MRSPALGTVILACGAFGCSSQPRARDSAAEFARALCAGVVIPMPEGVTPPVLDSSVKPEPGARASYPSATTCLEVQVETDGSVTYIRTISSTNAVFEDVFRRAVIRWRYRPAEIGGKPVAVRMTVSAAFEHH